MQSLIILQLPHSQSMCFLSATLVKMEIIVYVQSIFTFKRYAWLKRVSIRITKSNFVDYFFFGMSLGHHTSFDYIIITQVPLELMF